MVAKTIGIALIAALLFPGAAFAASQGSGSAADKQTVQQEKKNSHKALKEERQALHEQKAEERKARIEKHKETQAEKRAKVKEKVKEHRINKFQEIQAKKKANGSDKTPAYQKIVDWLTNALGIKE